MMRASTVTAPNDKHRLIVLDGIDGTGKTTVARKLAAALHAKYLRTPPPDFDAIRPRVDQQASIETRFLFTCAPSRMRQT